MSNERYIPHTNPEWNMKVPDGMTNSLVPKDSEKSHDDSFNFDEWDDPEPEEEETTWDDLKNEKMGDDGSAAE